jgi:hypothetical protein
VPARYAHRSRGHRAPYRRTAWREESASRGSVKVKQKDHVLVQLRAS